MNEWWNDKKKVALISAGMVVLLAVLSIVFFLFLKSQEEPEETPVVEEEVAEVEEDDSFDSRYPDFPTVDFEELYETNENVCGYILIPGTDVEYPILRDADSENPYDDYYLDVTIDGVSGLPGSIYMEPCNTGEYTEFNTVIYGHNMKNGSMFTTLHNYEEEEFFEEHPYVYIVTPEKKYVFEVDAAIFYDDRHIMAGYDFSNEDECEAFIFSVTENGDSRDHLRENVELTPEDHLVTLSTCTNGAESERYLIVARLVEME